MYCEFIKPKGVFFGEFKISNKKVTFCSTPNIDFNTMEGDMETFMKFSTNDVMRIKK